MSITGIQGHLLEVTVVGCYKLKDTEWISRQDPYVCLEYASTKFRTRTCTDGGKNPTFQEKFTFSLIEGLRELNVVVWNSNTVTYDDFIGSGKIQLHKVLSEGYDDCSWPLQTKTGRHAGEVRLILHYANAKKPAMSYAPSAPPYGAPSAPQVSMYSTPPPAAYGTHYPPPTNANAALLPYGSYPTSSAAYPADPYPPQPAAYPSPYPQSSAYPPPPYPQPSAYPPPPYPPPPHASPYYPPGPFPGIYPRPPY
ncbi:protein SRC2 homolog [Actinidia eriantha]|uniref:protein SRC2 homolog n=1 Tax=Actinidia eriantha TaxID=165200 RepID=UPI002588BCA9|nr:protein SRC2 homolog [Actinidia eriantha]